jgi:hypothetical protein
MSALPVEANRELRGRVLLLEVEATEEQEADARAAELQLHHRRVDPGDRNRHRLGYF